MKILPIIGYQNHNNYRKTSDKNIAFNGEEFDATKNLKETLTNRFIWGAGDINNVSVDYYSNDTVNLAVDLVKDKLPEHLRVKAYNLFLSFPPKYFKLGERNYSPKWYDRKVEQYGTKAEYIIREINSLTPNKIENEQSIFDELQEKITGVRYKFVSEENIIEYHKLKYGDSGYRKKVFDKIIDRYNQEYDKFEYKNNDMHVNDLEAENLRTPLYLMRKFKYKSQLQLMETVMDIYDKEENKDVKNLPLQERQELHKRQYNSSTLWRRFVRDLVPYEPEKMLATYSNFVDEEDAKFIIKLLNNPNHVPSIDEVDRKFANYKFNPNNMRIL